MVFLYTSLYNPKGKAAQLLMDKNSIQYKVFIIEESVNGEIRNRAEKLTQIFLERTSVSLSLPFLTQENNGQERVVLSGFVPSEWEGFFHLQTSSPQKTGSELAGIPAGDRIRLDLTHVPVVGAEDKLPLAQEKPLQ